MLRAWARDRPTAGLAALFLFESATLDVIMKAFVKGLFDDEVRKDTTYDHRPVFPRALYISRRC